MCPVIRYSRDEPIRSARVVFRRENLRCQLFRQAGFGLEGGDARIRHGNGAGMSRFILRGHHHQGRARHLRSGFLFKPRKAVDLMGDGGPHEAVPRGMKDDFIAPRAIAVVRVQHRPVLVRLEPLALKLLGSQQPAKFAELRKRPAGAGSLHRFRQRCVAEKQVVTGQRRNLVDDFGALSLQIGGKRVHTRKL